jgi:fructose-specific phosphotransferase system IIA component
MRVYNLLTPEMVILELESVTRDDAIKEMVGFLKKKNKVSREKELNEKLLQREELGSTAIGDGVAIPHCKMKGIENPIVMLSISRKGVDFHSLDGEPSRLFFLVVSSPDNPSVNLQILAAIAQLVRKAEQVKERILEAENTNTVLDVIRDEEDKLNT